MTRRAGRTTLVLTCEHAGNEIPRPHASLFRGARAALASHRGWDPGALPLARLLARELKRPLLAVTWSRLLVEANRSLDNPRLWSGLTADLPAAEQAAIVQRYWLPHRRQVERAVDAGTARGGRVLHVAVHSFTPELDGEVRNADVAFLYDSRRKGEARLFRRWAALLRELDPTLRVRFNYPYRGNTDGLPTWLRHRHPERSYLGTELEVNQALLATPRWRKVGLALAASLAQVLAD